MKKFFENPVIEVSGFDIENVVTTSSLLTNEAVTMANLGKVGVSDVKVIGFDEIIAME